MRFVLAMVTALFWAMDGQAQASCVGSNLVDALPEAERGALRAATDAVPLAQGNMWRASRGDAVVHVIGTYHMQDPRHEETMARLAPLIAQAATVLVEAGPEEMAALKAHMAREPGLIVNTDGPTLPEVLPPDVWDSLSGAMERRGIPAFMAAKFRPWYVSMMLSIPPCALAEMGADRGLDKLVTEAAMAEGVPVRALEPYDTILTIFDSLSPENEMSMITSALALDDRAEDMAVTMADLYFREESRMIWEFMRVQTLAMPGYTPERVERELAVMEEALMNRRNRDWILVITEAAAQGPVLAAFGALHLSGREGVLQLLQDEGFVLERLAFR